jgi:hypothetical protein
VGDFLSLRVGHSRAEMKLVKTGYWPHKHPFIKKLMERIITEAEPMVRPDDDPGEEDKLLEEFGRRLDARLSEQIVVMCGSGDRCLALISGSVQPIRIYAAWEKEADLSDVKFSSPPDQRVFMIEVVLRAKTEEQEGGPLHLKIAVIYELICD